MSGRFINPAVKFVVALSLAGLSVPGWPSTGEAVVQPSDYFLQILLSLLLVIGIIFVSAWLLRRYGRFPGVANGQLKVIGALSVGQRERILLLQVGEEQLLVGVTSSRISTLHRLEKPIEVENPPESEAFSQSLQGFVQKYKRVQKDGET
ncbi:flagellar biosynthetic protein FliO [Thiomicrorhabdus sp.]|uniref:flagellar biosynthetic protein FliO n=1 Tax=Thiomicrorhabdus sp. TaxID=2039724 RepID=UPI0029C97AF2|nr:flagellar biosynthetic protein FliO [Thiomicrorhabdus sp.]